MSTPTTRTSLYRWLDLISEPLTADGGAILDCLPDTESELTTWIDALADVDFGSDFVDGLRESIVQKYGDRSGPIMWTHALYNTHQATVTRRAIGDLTTAIAAAADLIGQASAHLDETLSSAPYCVAGGDLSHFLNEARRALVAAGAINRGAAAVAQ